MALSEDPQKALTLATTPEEVRQAQEAIKRFKATQAQSLRANNTRIAKIPAPRTQGFRPSSARGRGRGRGCGATSAGPSSPIPQTVTVQETTEEQVDEDCTTSEDDESVSDMATLRKVVAKKSQQAGVHHEGEVVQLDQLIDEDTARYPEPEPAPVLTMSDVMPAGKVPDTNQEMVVNMQHDKNFIEFILTQRHCEVAKAGGRQKGLSLPNHEVFCCIIAQATNDLINQKPDWMLLVKGAKFNQYGIGVFSSTMVIRKDASSSETSYKHDLMPRPSMRPGPPATSSRQTVSAFTSMWDSNRSRSRTSTSA